MLHRLLNPVFGKVAGYRTAAKIRSGAPRLESGKDNGPIVERWMHAVSHVYDVPSSPDMDCRITGRIALPGVVMEVHHYRFRGPQGGVFSSPRSFLDLAISSRPGQPRGSFGYKGMDGLYGLGDVLFIPAGNSLSTEWGEGEQVSICCAFDDWGALADDFDLTEEALQASLDVRSMAVRESLMRIAGEIEQPGFCSEMLIQAIWMQTSVELQRYLRRSPDGSRGANGLTRLQLQRIDDRIAQPGKPPLVGELASECGLSSRHFFRQFKIATGQTLTAYVAIRKIDRAKQILRMGGTPIKVIAWECGFDSAAAFSAAFRKAVGLTPKEYRQSLVH